MPSTTPISVSTTRISISVMPACRARPRHDIPRAPRPCKLRWVFTIMSSFARDARNRVGAQQKIGWTRFRCEFAHAHHAEQDREHDAADEDRESENQHRLEHREEALDRSRHFA